MTATITRDNAATLRTIAALTEELPAPSGLSFGSEGYLTLTYATVDDLLAWNARLGLREMQTRKPTEGSELLTTWYVGEWRGHRASAWAHEPAAVAQADADVLAGDVAERCHWVGGCDQSAVDDFDRLCAEHLAPIAASRVTASTAEVAA